MGTEKMIIGGVTAADNRHNEEQLTKKEEAAIKYLKTIAAKYQPLFLAYSGGKDSEVILHLATKAKIDFTPFYNNTTIDPPGTLSYIKKKEIIMVMQPRKNFFSLIEHRGLPSTFQRFCCDKLKERFVGRYIIVGVRKSESMKRNQRYQEPEQCRIYKSGQRGIVIMPILYWTNSDIENYIHKEKIQCHPLYYDNTGTFHVERRLGCLACPLRYDRGKKDFIRYPKLVRAWCRALAVYRNTRPTLTKSISHFNDEYENFYKNVFLRNMEELNSLRDRTEGFDARKELMNYFGIQLPPPQSPLNRIKQRLQCTTR